MSGCTISGSAGLSGYFGAGQRAALQAFAGVGDGALIGGLPRGRGPGCRRRGARCSSWRTSPACPCAARRPASPAASSKFITQVAEALIPILCSMRAAGDAVARRQGCRPALTQEFRHEEQADALDALRRIGQAGQHQMDDVLGQVMLAGGDEDLRAGDVVAAVACGTARVRNRPRSVPQCGSVRHMVPDQVPSTSFGR